MRILQFVILAALAFNTISCQMTSNDLATDPLNDQLQYSIDSVSSQFSCSTDSMPRICASASAQFITIQTESTVAQNIENGINKEIVNSSNAEVKPESPKELVDNFINEYKQLDKEIDTYRMPWETETDLKVMLETPLFFEVSISAYTFTGGAHGNHFTRYLVFEKEHGLPLSLDSLLIPGTKLEVLKTGERIFRESENLEDQSLEDAGFWFPENAFYLPDNYLYTSDGLIFIYNPYDVAAYAKGYIELLIPYGDAEAWIKQKYRLIPQTEA